MSDDFTGADWQVERAHRDVESAQLRAARRREARIQEGQAPLRPQQRGLRGWLSRLRAFTRAGGRR